MKTIRGKFRAAALMGTAALALAFASGAHAQNQDSQDQNNDKQWLFGSPAAQIDNPWPYNKPTRSAPVLVAVGDVACQPGETEPSGEKAGENCLGDIATTGPYAGDQILLVSQALTAKQIETIKPDLVALLGDEQYQVGQYSDFENSYETSYGAFKMITRPAPGNHEFYYEHGAIGVAGYGYFSYFNGVQHNMDGTVMTATISGVPDTGSTATTGGTFTQPVPYSDGQAGHFEESGGLGISTGVGASEPVNGPVGVGDGWYSYNLGSWHLISLNIECETQPGGCSPTGSTTGNDIGNWFETELAWLQKDLEENHSACTLAYWHQPTFSAANTITAPEGPTAAAFWKLLYQYGADVILNGHDHLYAHYVPLKPVLVTPATTTTPAIWSGVYDPKKGIREFIVGTGGETLDAVGNGTASDPASTPNFNNMYLEKATGYYWGVMSLTLDEHGYKWDFESALKDPTQTTAGALAANASYSDTGSATCHGGPDGDNNSDADNQGGR